MTTKDSRTKKHSGTGHSNLETFLKAKILPDLEKGRPGFDAPHTLEVVAWLKRILKNEKKMAIDREVLIIAAYAHDWGYSGMFKHGKTLNINEVIGAKQRHMVLGAQKLTALLTKPFFSFLTKSQKKRCIHLVAVHDKLKKLHDVDELILLEADTLSGLDVQGKSLFDTASNKKFVSAVTKTRVPLFITAFGKRQAKRLLEKRRVFYTK